MSHICDGRDLTCASCLALARRLETVRATMTVDDELDDVKRARIWMQLEERLADSGPARRPRAAIAIGLAAAGAVAAAGLFLALSPRTDDRHTLAVPVDTVVTSRLGPHTFASIAGPAQLDILGASGEATAIRLHSGTVLVEFVGGSGRSLRVEAPGATVEVVGTLFAVAVRDGATCTSVAHGAVRVAMRTGVVHVAEGQRYCTGEAIRPIADDVRDALTQHGSRVARSRSAEDGAAKPASESASTSTASQLSPASIASPESPPSATSPPSAASIASPKSPPSATSPPSAASAASAASSAPAASSASSASAPSIALPASPGSAASPGSSASSALAASAESIASPASHGSAASPASIRSTASLRSTGSIRSTASPPPAAPPLAVNARPSEPAPAIAESKPTASADELYQQAEAALAARDTAAADRALATLIDEHPISLLVDQALYERARIAYQQRSWDAARSHLARLAAVVGTRLAEPGRYLRCRIAVESKESSAAACLTDYRAAFPSSPHDLDALALLAQLAHASAGCAGAEKLVAELAERYPRATLATAWRARCPEPR